MKKALDFYKKEAEGSRSKLPWLAKIQQRAESEFQYRAFPTRKDEDWKYTALDAFLETSFASVPQQDLKHRPDPAQLPIGSEISLYNGQVFMAPGLKESLPAGVIIKPLLSALSEDEDIVRPWFGKLLNNEHGFHALNMAILQSGLLVYLPKGVQITDPLVFAHYQDRAEGAVHARHLVILEEGAALCMIESYQGLEGIPYFSNVVTEAYLGPRSKMIHYKLQQESKAAFHIGHLAVQQSGASRFESHSLSLGARLARLDLSLKFIEKDASCLLNGIYLPTDGQHIDHHTSIHHLVPHCESQQDYKGILTGKSRAVFNGKVIVSKGAIKTKAAQENKNLLLSLNAEIDTKPQLDIFADDVVCTHGATVGQLDDDALFYMASRGIEPNDARAFLIAAFVTHNVLSLPHKAMRDWMADRINQQLINN